MRDAGRARGRQVDEVLFEIGVRAANDFLQNPLDDDTLDDTIADKLDGAGQVQRFGVADLMVDVLALCQLLRWSTEDRELGAEEIDDMRALVDALEADTRLLMLDLVG